jgi:hypothetical protein
LNNLTTALDETGMKFSTEKTAVMVFSKKNVDTTLLPKLMMYIQQTTRIPGTNQILGSYV